MEVDQTEHSNTDSNTPVNSNTDSSVNNTSTSGTVQYVRYLDDVLVMAEDNSQLPTQQEVDLNNKN